IALVMLDDKGTPSAFRHALTPAEICGRDVARTGFINWQFSGAGFALDRPRSEIALEIDASGGPRCIPHTLQLQKADFATAKTEVNRKPTYTYGVIYRGRVVVPPKEKQEK